MEQTEMGSEMANAAAERRHRRSEDVITALHYQLAAAKHEAGLDAVVLVDDRGSLLASAGAWAGCEELAAFAPLLADPAAASSHSVAGRLSALAETTTSLALSVDGTEVLLCGKGQRTDPSALMRAAAGCRRILS